jgi:hypothetical protein
MDMTRHQARFALAAIIAAAALLSATAAIALAASKKPTPYGRYTLSGSRQLSGLTVNYRAYALLPTKLPDRTANGRSVLRFGPIGSCRYQLGISIRVVSRTGSESADERVNRLLPASQQYVYARGTRASASWRVIRVRGSATVRGRYVMPTSIATGATFDSPRRPVWLEVTGTGTEPVRECHSGGPRYIGATLADAFGAMTSTAFSTDLPRPAAPPAP